MTGPVPAPGRWRRGRALATVAVLSALLSPAALAPLGGPAAADTAGALTLQVVSVSPNAPARSATKRPLVVTLRLTNTTGAEVSGVQITGVRGDPVSTQANLDDIVDDASPKSEGVAIEPTKPVKLDVPADGVAHTVYFRGTYGVPNDPGNVCQCAQEGVYPLYFTASRTTSDGTVKRLDTAVTFLPSFLSKPQPVRVAWVWPLIDRPHRLSSSTAFLDDSLATEVAFGGRLDRSLETVERVVDTIPITLLVDPELLDELEVMATSRYTVQATSKTPAVTGTGRDAAAAWLTRFTRLLDTHPNMRVALTPYADPDVTSLSLNGLGWHTAMPTDMTTRVTTALDGRALDYSLTWPASGAYTGKALDTLIRSGASSTLLPSTAVSPRDGADGGLAAGTARITRPGGTVSVGLLSPAIQSDVADTVTRSNDSVDHTSRLLAEIAVRAAAQPRAAHTLVITPPRYVNPVPDLAVRTIQESSESPFARPISLDGALSSDRLPSTRSKLAAVPSSLRTLPSHLISPASDVSSDLSAIDSMLGGKTATAAAQRYVASFPIALQRVTSSYWVTHPDAGTQLADTLRSQADMLTGGQYVSIVLPSSASSTRGGTYTLASANSKLPVTVRNRLPYAVRFRLIVKTDNGLPGFALRRDIGVQTVDPQSRRTLQLPTTIARTGRLQLEAQLLTPQRTTIGESVPLTVHSTALGVVGVVITVVAGAVLALALLVRLVRMLLRRRRRTPSPRGTKPEPVT